MIVSVKTKIVPVFILALALSRADVSAQPLVSSTAFINLEGTHDLHLPDWGPYTKRYIGVSHIPIESRERTSIRS